MLATVRYDHFGSAQVGSVARFPAAIPPDGHAVAPIPLTRKDVDPQGCSYEIASSLLHVSRLHAVNQLSLPGATRFRDPAGRSTIERFRAAGSFGGDRT